MGRLRLRPSPALFVAVLALFLAMSGGAYAVTTTLGRNTVGTKQLKSGAVTATKLRDAAVTGPKLAANAVTSGNVADGSLVARDFATGQLQASLGTLAAGHTESGTWALGGNAYTTGATLLGAASFPIPLAAGLDASHVVYVTGSSATHCPGIGQAEAGYLCLYETTHNALNPSVPTIIDPTSNAAASGASRFGFLVAGASTGTNPGSYAWGTWAVTG